LLGPRLYSREATDMYGRPNASLSPETSERIEQEITRIITEQYDRAREIVESNRDKLEVMTRKLLDWETLEADQIEQIMNGQEPRTPEEGNDSSNKGGNSKTPESQDSDLSEADIDLPDPNESLFT